MNVLDRHDRSIYLDRKSISETIRKRFSLEPFDVQVGLEVAGSYLRDGAIDQAFRTFILLVLQDPCEPVSQIGLAHCALQVGQSELALQAASMVIALAPSDPRGYFLSGQACLALRHFAEAKEDLLNAAEFGRQVNNTAVVADADRLLASLSTAAA